MPPRIEIAGVREQHARSWRRNVRIRRLERSLRRPNGDYSNQIGKNKVGKS
jgi:hypothetical protein